MAQAVALAAASAAFGLLAKSLLPKGKRPEIDQKKPSLASRGTFIPILIGRHQIKPNILHVWGRTVTEEGHAGGKGVSGSGSTQQVYRENAWHSICVGPARKLHEIRENDKVIWTSADAGSAFVRGISADTHPSGSTISVPGHGSFRIYWGEQDQPVDPVLSAELGHDTRHKFMCYVMWIQKRLGGSTVWGDLAYDVECRPYKTGDTFAHTGPYEGSNGLPERLQRSVGWFQNGLGPASTPSPHDILLALDGIPGVALVKLAGNVVPFGPTPPFAEIEGNSAIADGRYAVDSATYNATETLRYPTGSYTEVVGASGDAINDWTPDSSIASIAFDPFGTPPPNATRGGSYVENGVYKATLDQPFTGWRDLTLTTVTGASEQFLSPGVNHVRVFFRAFGQSNFTKIRIRLEGYDHPSLGDEEADVVYEYLPGGVPLVTGTNGAYGEIVDVGIDVGGGSGPFFRWWQVDFYYQSGTGSSPFDENWKRKVRISIEADDAAFVWFYVNDGDLQPVELNLFETAFLSDDDGSLQTGITTVVFDDTLTGSERTGGTLEFLFNNSGDDGANIAHSIDQLLFESWPHGIGLPRSRFDMESLEVLGEELGPDGEGLRTHLLLEDGTTVEAAIANILIDVGMMIPWDVTTAKYVFKLIREPTGAVTLLPSEAVSSPLPEITKRLERTTPDRRTYLYKDRHYNFHDVPITFDDDGQASKTDAQNTKQDRLFIVTDFDAAQQVAFRREQLELSPPTTYEIQALRAARRLIPGDPLDIEGMQERLQISEVGPVISGSSKVRIQALTDIYSAPLPSP